MIVDGRGTGYLRTVCDYVHLNPARAKLVKPEQALRDYAWSSFPEYFGGEGKQESAEEHAERLVEEALGRMRWTETDLSHRRKGDPSKMRLARQLRGETTMTLQWIASRLQMGTASMVTFCLRQRT